MFSNHITITPPCSKRKTEGMFPFFLTTPLSPSLTQNARQRGYFPTTSSLPRSKSEMEGIFPLSNASPLPRSKHETMGMSLFPTTSPSPSLARHARRRGCFLFFQPHHYCPPSLEMRDGRDPSFLSNHITITLPHLSLTQTQKVWMWPYFVCLGTLHFFPHSEHKKHSCNGCVLYKVGATRNRPPYVIQKPVQRRTQ